MKVLLWLACLVPGMGLTQSIKFRKYKKGHEFRYQLTTESFRNNQPDSKTISISNHIIIEDSGLLAEQVTWSGKTVFSKNDTLHLDTLARKIAPYKISLSPGAQLKLPPLTIPEMTGELTDLNTFYVAISPALHMHRLGPNRLSFRDSVLRGNFADGKQILAGEDCIQVTQKLLTLDKRITIVETSFDPPATPGITPFADTIGHPLFNVPNNFQMIRRAGSDKVNLLWGTERFTIISTLDNETGMLLKAEMTNVLNLKMRVNCSQDLRTYAAEIPLTIVRELQLVLLK